MKYFYKKFVKEGDLVFDIGANIGNRTIIFRKLGCFVIAVEPQNNCVKKLNKIFKNDSKVIIVQKGCDKIIAHKTISICSDSPTISSMSDEFIKKGRFSNQYEWDTNQEVDVITLDKLIEEFGQPTFCKIDVEGYEKEVIQGLTIPIKTISFEFSNEFLEHAEFIINYLNEIGDYTFNVSFGESMTLALDNFAAKESFLKNLNNLSSNYSWGDIYATLIDSKCSDI
jgi:FkbM family methyltransferase